MRVPGASVEGHRGAVRVRGRDAETRCSCGRPFPDQPTVQAACLVLVLHLQAAVRDGAGVTGPDDDDGAAGVREPRGPVPSRGSGGVAYDGA